MTTAAAELRAARKDDLAAVRALLDEGGLPSADISAEKLRDFLVLIDADELLACGGVEVHGVDALLRSVAVRPALRNAGAGGTLVQALERRARERGVTTLYLLTTTAADYFPRLGYAVTARDAVPAAIAQTAEFASLCPASAVCLKKRLE